ncbi:hypothetical protein H2199_004277 [Coniosporium tulheliwenetii]|uniref:Uncharacterized protein n=1 Tax=Coniosporium tulheliwenetii TaxID=3383036 RepID=A0ACC2Z7F2_9PEZI|nr:hypothetical protein H2199_004277 [Cladosporium sp. JES 115]
MLSFDALMMHFWMHPVVTYVKRNNVLSDQAKSSKGRNCKGWNYQGVSTDAFTEEKQYLGPFHGHVNGALVMKELHNFVSNLLVSDKERFMDAPYLTDQTTRMLFSRVSSAESMELIVQDGVSKWYNTRKQMDFFKDLRQLRPQPLNIRRWVAHALLTTTTNIAVAQCYGEKWYAPTDHFYNQEMLSQYSGTGLLKGVGVPDFLFDMWHYTKARDNLGLALIQNVDEAPADYPELRLPEGTLGGGKDPGRFNVTRFVQLAAGEGECGTFIILQPSYEDAQGVLVMQTIKMKAGKTLSSVLSAKAFNALMMVDFWNPIYSWRRAVLMQYVPETASFDPESNRYDLEDVFIANVKKSGFYTRGDRESPEFQFISLLEVGLEQH